MYTQRTQVLNSVILQQHKNGVEDINHHTLSCAYLSCFGSSNTVFFSFCSLASKAPKPVNCFSNWHLGSASAWPAQDSRSRLCNGPLDAKDSHFQSGPWTSSSVVPRSSLIRYALHFPSPRSRIPGPRHMHCTSRSQSTNLKTIGLVNLCESLVLFSEQNTKQVTPHMGFRHGQTFGFRSINS